MSCNDSYRIIMTLFLLYKTLPSYKSNQVLRWQDFLFVLMIIIDIFRIWVYNDYVPKTVKFMINSKSFILTVIQIYNKEFFNNETHKN